MTCTRYKVWGIILKLKRHYQYNASQKNTTRCLTCVTSTNSKPYEVPQVWLDTSRCVNKVGSIDFWIKKMGQTNIIDFTCDKNWIDQIWSEKIEQNQAFWGRFGLVFADWFWSNLLTFFSPKPSCRFVFVLSSNPINLSLY